MHNLNKFFATVGIVITLRSLKHSECFAFFALILQKILMMDGECPGKLLFKRQKLVMHEIFLHLSRSREKLFNHIILRQGVNTLRFVKKFLLQA
jgi:hypothetical protein